ncbi:MAG: hypothetical protein K2N38_01490 [Oscillospiraceae bacterium]|nr:hypothetical protein [Oscillospiraceae bacterium]
MAIDKADWHWDEAEKAFRGRTGKTGELTEEQQDEIWHYAADHIGLFLRWIIDNGFESEDEDFADPMYCERVRSGSMTGAEYLMSNCDGKLCEEDLCGDIVPFVLDYYEQYLKDYFAVVASSGCYSLISGDKEYNKIRPVIDKAYENFTSK